MSISGIILAIVVLGFLIFFHELGHFCVARVFGMGVKTFSLGFGPRLVGIKRGKTEYQIAAVPLGGYVSLVGQDPGEELPEGFTSKEEFSTRPTWQRFLVILAGPVFNALLAWFIYWGMFVANGQIILMPVAGAVQTGSPAAQAALARTIAYGPTNTKALSQLDPQVLEQLPTSPANSKNALRFDAAFWANHGAALEQRFHTWLLQ